MRANKLPGERGILSEAGARLSECLSLGRMLLQQGYRREVVAARGGGGGEKCGGKARRRRMARGGARSMEPKSGSVWEGKWGRSGNGPNGTVFSSKAKKGLKFSND
jgi:hypothetical protein